MKNKKVNAGWGVFWPAPGKLNLMLRIVGRRADGYHSLQTVFQFIDRCDQLSFNVSSDGTVYLKSPLPGVPEQEDLTVRAANLLKAESGCEQGVEISVNKVLPMGGGLGGGSSDAATTLVVLNRLWGLGYSESELMRMGLSLGADVPVFIGGHSAWAEGVGEQLEALTLVEPWYVIVVPDCHVSTIDVFNAENLTRDSKSVTISDFMSGRHRNDCLAVVEEMYPPVKVAIDALSEYGEARLTGTGACVYLALDSKSSATKVVRDLSSHYQAYAVKGNNRSPLHEKMRNVLGGGAVDR